MKTKRTLQFLALMVTAILTSAFTAFAYVKGDVDGDDKVGLQEAIYSLQAASNLKFPLSSNTINVPSDIPTIQEAVDAASDGDIILLAAQTYTEAITINKKSIILRGAGRDQTVIDGNGEHVITIEASPGVAIENLAVQNGNKGIYAHNNSKVKISQLIVQDCSDRGVQIGDSSVGELSDTTIENNGGDGVGVLLNSSLTINGTVDITNNRYGIVALLSSAVLFDNSTITSQGNAVDGVVAVSNSALYTYLSTLTLDSNNRDGMRVAVNSSSYNNANGTINSSGNAENGISVFGTSRLYSAGNISVQGSGEFGIIGEGSCDISIEGPCSIQTCSNTGFIAARSSSVWLESELQILNCSGYGISIERASALQNNDAAVIAVTGTVEPWGVGIGVNGNSIWRANGGSFTIQNNSGSGIAVGRNSTLSLRNRGSGLSATISGNSGSGIFSYQQGCIRLDQGVALSDNSENGISLYSSSECDIHDIAIQNNSTWGINADKLSSVNVYDSTISGNTNGDVNLSFGSVSELIGNTIGTMSCDSTVLSRGTHTCSQ